MNGCLVPGCNCDQPREYSYGRAEREAADDKIRGRPRSRRKPEWKQETPRDELVCLVMAAQGHLSNVISGDAGQNRLKDVAVFLEDVQHVLHHFKMDSNWEPRQ